MEVVGVPLEPKPGEQASTAPTGRRAATEGSYGVGSWTLGPIFRQVPCLYVYAGHDGWLKVGLRGRVLGDKCVAAGLNQ